MNEKTEPTSVLRLKLIEEMRTGRFSDCDRLPRETVLSEQYGISRTHLRDILAQLEREGFIENFTGKGCFVKAQNPEFLREEIIRQTEEQLSKACEIARQGGLTLEELTELLELMYGGNNDA